jgi:hypothetical protein
MKQFKIKENGFKEIRKQALIRTIPMILIAMIVGLVIFELNPNNKDSSDINVYPIVIPIILGALSFGLIKGLKRQKAIYDTYTLEIDDTGVTREQVNTPLIRLLFSDITKITKSNQGGLVITGKNLSHSIIIPAQIDDMTMIEAIIQENCNIRIGISIPLIQRLIIPLMIAVLGLMAITYISTNKILVSFSGTTLTAIMIWSFIKTQSNKNIDKKNKRSSYWIILVILSIIGVMISKLMN